MTVTARSEEITPGSCFFFLVAVLPIEMFTAERIAELVRESEVDADTRAAVREALGHTGV
jgi:hypothetical protein